jgi:dihydrofolate reductase
MIHALFAVDKFGGMGLNGTLPWPHHPEDLAYFKQQTLGHIVVMGRNTWDDPKMPKPLPSREVYVATTKPINHPNTINGDLKQALLALEKANPTKIIWVIGGPALLAQCDGLLDKMHLTHHKSSYKIDSKIDLKTFLSGWTPHTATAAPNTNCSFVTYVPIFRRLKTNP